MKVRLYESTVYGFDFILCALFFREYVLSFDHSYEKISYYKYI